MAAGLCKVIINHSGKERALSKNFMSTDGWRYNMDITKPYYARKAQDLTKFLSDLHGQTKIFSREIVAFASGKGGTTVQEMYGPLLNGKKPYCCLVVDKRGGLKLVVTKARLPREFVVLGHDNRSECFVPLIFTMNSGQVVAINND